MTRVMFLYLFAMAICRAATPLPEQVLPPLPPAKLQSLGLIASADDPWITPAERSGLTETPDYQQTFDYVQRLVAASPRLRLVSLGRSAQGRDIWMVVAAASGTANPSRLRANGKPTMLAQAGIHAGEIDGKDAGLMLLRDMTVAGTRSELLQQANFLFVPILNVDGHERASRFNRINQRGPVVSGWRSNSRNLNLNRDYTKLETEEVAAIVDAINQWRPDLYLDLHVTDGIDYEYDITFGYNGTHAWSPRIARWMDRYLQPAAYRDLAALGHVPGPLIFAENGVDYAAGISDWTASPRYSNGYGDARHLATVLVENHSLKPYLQRVLGTYVLLESMLRTLGRHGEDLQQATQADSESKSDEIVLAWRQQEGVLPETMLFRGVDSTREYSEIAGTEIVRWNGQLREQTVVVRSNNAPATTVSRPSHYYIPRAWGAIADKLRAHGIEVTELGNNDSVDAIEVEQYRLPAAAVASGTNPYEGRMRITPGDPVVETNRVVPGNGDYLVATSQPLGTLAVLMLEPQSPDSLLQWGYFLEIMNRTGYFDRYAAEPLARSLLQSDPELAQAFRARLKNDPAFAADPDARLRWFYERTPYDDEHYRLYPIARVLNHGGSGRSTTNEEGK
ncbi:MAG: M14 family metallopeptidase [Gammaproteobacteria bacterium]|nr:M14 family metallopeptidase [Gammaproteobacteria bacterium]